MTVSAARTRAIVMLSEQAVREANDEGVEAPLMVFTTEVAIGSFDCVGSSLSELPTTLRMTRLPELETGN
jgi:hypothetical protein